MVERISRFPNVTVSSGDWLTALVVLAVMAVFFAVVIYTIEHKRVTPVTGATGSRAALPV
jgi:heme O synthase-like polyprenyltransferase